MVVSTCRVELIRGLDHIGTMKAYYLHITNLEDRGFEYLLNVVMTVSAVRPLGAVIVFPAAHEVTQFAWITGVTGGPLRVESFRRTGDTYTAAMYFRVKPRQTIRLRIFPRGAFDDSAFNRLDGYVTLRLPATRTERRPFTKQPQSDRPVKVLLNPETHFVYGIPAQSFDVYDDPPPFSLGPQLGPKPAPIVDLPPVKRGYAQLPGQTFVHTEPLHIASGKAENELRPEGSRVLTAGDLRYAEDAVKADDDEARQYRGSELVTDQDRAGALIELLCELEDDALTDAVNKVLESQKAAMRVCKA
jgi:hypothetical protein